LPNRNLQKMEQLPNIVRGRLKATAGGDHPDADLLTAFAEQALPDQERSRVLLHLSRCADCRDVLALAVPPVKAVAPLDTARPAPWFQWKVLRWGVAVTCVAIVGSAVLMRRDTFPTQSAKTAAVREEPKAEQYAYQRIDQDTAAGQLAQQTISSNAENANEKDMGRVGDKALKRPMPPKLPASAPATPAAPIVALSPGVKDNKQAIVGAMHGSGSAGAFGAMAAKPADNRISAPAQTVSDESKKSLRESRIVTDLATLGKSSETVEVHTGALGLDTESSSDKREAPGKAKAASSGVLDAMAPPEVVTQSQETRSEETVRQKMDRAPAVRHSPLSRWTISSDGRLQHSIDAGKTWQPVPVADKASFRALSANGPDVWVGGAAGLLYHSGDSGASWTQVKPTFASVTLTTDIAAIEFTDLQHGKITTSNGEVWTTEDAGQTWRKQ
jgi:hypothetical protein